MVHVNFILEQPDSTVNLFLDHGASFLFFRIVIRVIVDRKRYELNGYASRSYHYWKYFDSHAWRIWMDSS